MHFVNNKACLQWQPKAKDYSSHEGGHCSPTHGWPYGIWGKAHRKGLGEQQLLSQHSLPVSSTSATLLWSKTALQYMLSKIQNKMIPPSPWESSTALASSHAGLLMCSNGLQPDVNSRANIWHTKWNIRSHIHSTHVAFWYSSSCNLYYTDEAQRATCVSVGVKRLIASICYINMVYDGRRLIDEK